MPYDPARYAPDNGDDRPQISENARAPRAEAMKRLQVGVLGLAAVMMMIGLAKVVMDRANETDATAVPEAVEQAAVETTPKKGKDPLADAGVVPDLPAAKPAPIVLPNTPSQEEAHEEARDNRPARTP